MNTQLNIDKLDNQVKECMGVIQQEIDSSYNRIDVFLDSIILDPCSLVSNTTSISTIPIPQIPYPSIQTFTHQLVQQVQPIINSIINKSIQHKQSQIQQQSQQPLNYNLIQNRSIKQNQWCRAIAFNKYNSIVLAACGNDIKVFEFKQEWLKQIQLLSEHKYNVTTLNFMKKSNHFISGSEDSQIIIWTMNQNSQWVCQQKLIEHTKCINCLILNNNEDLIISGSDDKTIKFWMKQNQWLCSQTITDHNNYVSGLCLNDQQNRLISCGLDKLILIIEQSSQDKKWNVIQKINVEVYGRRLCFMDDNVFAVQPHAKEQMHIYEMSNANKQYSKTKEISVKCGYNGCNYYFAQQYIKSKQLVVNKNGYNINLIRKNQNGDFITQQSIDFGDYCIYGQMSENGEYLMTWDQKSNEIQIRKCNKE